MRVFVCEKPSQARDIAAVLGANRKSEGFLAGDDVAVTWCYGHLFETAPPESYDPALKKWSLDTLPILPGEWKLELKPSAAKQFKAIRSLVKRAGIVIIATDADREGETIGREVLDACQWRGPLQRLWLSALDPASIRKALTQILPGEKTAPLYAAGVARSRADWLVGMNLTRAYTLLNRTGSGEGVYSVGRVQTPTLRLVVDRDREIEAFVSKAYWEVIAGLQNPGRPQPFNTRWRVPDPHADAEGRCTNERAARTVAQSVPGTGGRVELAQTERKHQPPPLLYDLSTLQQDCSRRFGMTAQATLDTAQRLYETYKATTYPRTDSQYLPTEQFAAAPDVLAAVRRSHWDRGMAALIANADMRLRSRAWNDSKITAHHAIIPTSAPIRVADMSEDDRRVYDLVVRRYLAQFYPNYDYDQTRIEARFSQEVFVATGVTPVTTGWKAVYVDAPEGEDEPEGAAPLPRLSQGDALVCLSAKVEAKQTKPPARHTEGTLLQAMKSVGARVDDPALKKILRETSGIGTEATRASIIETLVQRAYIERQGKKKALVSTAKGRKLIDILPAPVKDPATTALWEQALEEIAAGRAPMGPFLERQASWVRQIVDRARQARS